MFLFGVELLLFEEGREEVVLFARDRTGFIEEHDVRSVCDEVFTLDAADRSHGERRRVCRGRTDRAGIGIGDEVGIALFAAERGVIAVARRRHEADARFVDLIVNIVEERLVHLARKPAGRAERHVDGVHFQKDGVLERGDDIRRLGARFQIGKDLHEDELRIHRDARDLVVLAADDARDVGAVAAVVREYVAILIRIVVFVRDLGAVPYVGKRHAVGKFARLGLGDLFAELILREQQRLGGRIKAEHGVAAIEARVEDRDRRARALVGNVARIEDTRVVYVDVVDDRGGVRPAGERLRTVVCIGKIDVLHAGDGAERLDLAVFRLDGDGVREDGIAVFHLLDQPFGDAVADELALERLDLARLRPALCGVRILRERAVRILQPAAEIGIGKGGGVELDDGGNEVAVGISAVFDEIVRLDTGEHVFLRDLRVALEEAELLRVPFPVPDRVSRVLRQGGTARTKTKRHCERHDDSNNRFTHNVPL